MDFCISSMQIKKLNKTNTMQETFKYKYATIQDSEPVIYKKLPSKVLKKCLMKNFQVALL